MTTFLCILVFIAIGAAVGFVGSMISEKANRMVSIVLGLAGSLGISWIVSLFGLGAGFVSFSLWGIIAGIVGACLLVGIYAAVSKR